MKEGKDRKGKDRTGKDRTGQERKGQERKGQERTGQDRTGMESKAKQSKAKRSEAKRSKAKQSKAKQKLLSNHNKEPASYSTAVLTRAARKLRTGFLNQSMMRHGMDQAAPRRCKLAKHPLAGSAADTTH